jgi:hypothetical protein
MCHSQFWESLMDHEFTRTYMCIPRTCIWHHKWVFLVVFNWKVDKPPTYITLFWVLVPTIEEPINTDIGMQYHIFHSYREPFQYPSYTYKLLFNFCSNAAFVDLTCSHKYPLTEVFLLTFCICVSCFAIYSLFSESHCLCDVILSMLIFK